MERIGVLGGLGPETTSEFYLDLVRLGTKQTRPPVCIWSLPLNLKKESEYISFGRHTSYYFSLLKDGAERLENAGCDQIVIPCNTVHEFHRRLEKSIGIPVTNLIDVVTTEVRQRGWKKLFLLATSRLLRTGLYQEAFGRQGVDICMPTASEQVKLDSLIQGLLGDRVSDQHQKFLESVVGKGARRIVLGCTDLQLLFPASGDVVDSMHTLAVYTANQIKKG